MDILKNIGNSDFGSLLGQATQFGAVGIASKMIGQGGVTGPKGGKGNPLGDVFEIVTSGGPGGMVNTLCDKLGMPDWIGDLAGCALDIYCGNIPGAIANGADLSEDVFKELGMEELAPYAKMAGGLAGVFTGDMGSLKNLGQVAGSADDIMKTASSAQDLMGTVDDGSEAGQAAMGLLGELGSLGGDVDLASNQNIRA